MASLKDLFGTTGDEQDKTTSQGLNSPSDGTSFGSNATGGSGAPAPTKAPAKQGSGQFTNLQTIQSANEASRKQLADRLQGGIGQQAGQIKSEAQNKAGEFQKQADINKSTTGNLIEQAKGIASSGANATAEQLQALGAGVGGISAPQDISGLSDLSNDYSKLNRQASRQASNLGSSTGQIQNLRQLFGGKLSKGSLGLDQALLSGTDFSQARKDVLGAGLGVQSALQQGQASQGQIAKDIATAKQEAQQAGGAVEGALTAQGQAELDRRKSAIDKIQRKLSGEDVALTAEEAALAGIGNLDQSIGFSDATSIKKALDPNTIGSLTAANFLDDPKFAALRAAQGLSGGALTDEGTKRGGFDFFDENAVQNQTTKQTELGNYDRAGYQTALQNKLNADYTGLVGQNDANFEQRGSQYKYGGVSERGLLSLARENPARLGEIESELVKKLQTEPKNTSARAVYERMLASARDAANISAQEKATQNSNYEKLNHNDTFAGDNRTLRQLLGL